jgi:hypothetical protein
MPTYNGIEITEDFYTFFAPHFINLISPIQDPREQDNVKLNYTVPSYLAVIILGICQGATTMRQIALLSQDQAFQQQIAFLCEAGNTPRSQNSFTNLTEQLSPPEFQQQYNLILQELHESGAFIPFQMDVLPGMNAGVSIFATPSPIEGSRVAEEDVGRLGIEPGAPNAYPSPP